MTSGAMPGNHLPAEARERFVVATEVFSDQAAQLVAQGHPLEGMVGLAIFGDSMLFGWVANGDAVRQELLEGGDAMVSLFPKDLASDFLESFGPRALPLRNRLAEQTPEGTFWVLLAYGRDLYTLLVAATAGERGRMVRGGSA